MDFHQAEESYRKLRSQFESRRISPQDFRDEVLKLRIQDSSGAWWQVREADGAWLRWDGSSWQEASPSAAQTPSPLPVTTTAVTERAPAEPPPESLGQLFWLILKRLPKVMLKRLPLSIAIAVGVWAIHTYLLVGLNDGFAAGTNRYLDMVLALGGTRVVTGTLFWLVAGVVVSVIIGQMRRWGVRGFFSQLGTTPAWMIDSIQAGGMRVYASLFWGAAVASLLGAVIGNRLLSGLLAIGFFIVLKSWQDGFLFAVARLGWSDWQRWFQKNSPKTELDPSRATVFLIGLTVGFIPPAAMPYLPWSGVILAAVLVVLAASRRWQPSVAGILFLFAIAALWLVMSQEGVYAHDGGWKEAGGTFSDWITSEGAIIASIMGAGPAIGGLAGASLGGAAGGLGGGAGAGTASGDVSTGADASFTGDYYDSMGGPGDNPYTDFTGGEGPGQCPPGTVPIGLPNYWINTATLDLIIQDTVFTCQGLGPAIAITLTYNARSRKQGMFGPGWRLSYESTVEQNQGNILLWKGSGQGLRYRVGSVNTPPRPNQPVEAISSNGGFNRLLDYGAYWLFVEKETRLMYRYDKLSDTSESRLNAIYDRNGNTVQIQYNADGTIGAVIDAAGRSFTFTCNKMRRCTVLTLPDGRIATFSYDGQGNLVGVRDLLDIPSDYEYDADKFISRMIVGHDSKTTAFTYQGQGPRKRISAVTDAGGNTTRYEQSSTEPGQVRVMDPGERVFTYSSRGGMTEQVIDPLGKAVTYGYSGGKRVSVQARNGQTFRMEYDARGNMVSRIDALGMATNFTFDEYDNLLSETNPLGETWQYRYDNRGNLTEFISPIGRVFAAEYDSRGQAVVMIDGNGGRTNLSYDRFGNMEKTTDPMGNTVTFSHDPHGLMLTAITDARGNTTRYEYDRNNRLTRVTHPDGSTCLRTYDCCSEVATIDENGNESYTLRNPLLAIRELTDRRGNITRFDYDLSGQVIGVTDALGRRSVIDYDGAGRPIGWTNDMGGSIRLSRDAVGNLVSLTDERGSQTVFERDANGRLTRITDPLGNSRSFIWDPSGRLVSITNGRGNEISISRDTDGRIISKICDGDQVATYEYDATSNLTKTTDASGVTIYQYDAANRVILIRYPNGHEVSFTYDEAGNISTINYPDGLVVQYNYDNRNRFVAAIWGEHSISYRYDAMNNILNEVRSNGTESDYAHDADKGFIEVKHRKGNDVFVHLKYTRDAIGNVITESGISSLETSLADATINSSYNRADQLEACGAERCAYDADGNLTEISGGEWQAVYDAENRLIEVTRNGQKTSYTYNGLGQRAGVVNGHCSRRLYHDAWGRLLFETDDEGKLTSANIYAGGFLIARLNAAGETHFYHFDKTGSTLAMTDKDGQVIAAYAYSPFGTVVNRSGLTDENPFTYVGQFGVIDEGEGLFFMRRRFYDAVTGRFIQKDPIGFDGGINQYRYVENNPVGDIDPEGTFGFLACALVAGLILTTVLASGWCLACKVRGEKAPWNKALKLPSIESMEDRLEQAVQVGQEGMSYMGEYIMGLYDKMFITNPWASPGYSAVKTAGAAAEGDTVGVLRNAPCAIANKIGTAATAANELYDAYVENAKLKE